jgi:ParB family transcriptional regulator, chromosome partitioning protein
MARVKPGLGRGLDAVINRGRNEEREAKSDKNEALTNLPVDRIVENPFQPRTDFDPEALEELRKSILQNGLIQPVTVRRFEGGTYQLISGERRWRACRDIGYEKVPAYILDVASDELMLAMALIENIQRESLNPVEIGTAYKRLMDECNLTQEQIAEKVGKDRSTIANSIRLLRLSNEVRDALVKGKISMGHARALINAPDEATQIELMREIVAKNLSVRKVEKLAKERAAGGKPKSAPSKPSTPSRPDASVAAVEDAVRRALGTKVVVRARKDGAGVIFEGDRSRDELDRLLDLFDAIEKNS